MRKKEISSLDQRETAGQGKRLTEEKAGRKSYSKKYEKASSQPRRRRGNERANGGKKRQNDIHRQVYKLADLLTDEEISRLKGFK